jgi:glycosyltransferase involved in cell wall biosynthesis
MTKLKIGFCSLPLQSGHVARGVGSYTKNILREFKQNQDVEVVEFKETISDVDVIFYPFFDLFFHTLKISKKIPTVVMVHDAIPLQYPEHYPIGIRGKINLYLQQKSLQKAAAVITNSNFSKDEIVKYLKIPSNKVHSIYLAGSDVFKKISNQKINEVSEKYHLPDEFALYIGNVNWNKNIINMTRACVESKTHIVLVGKSFEERKNLDHPELKSFKEFLNKFENNPYVHMLGFIEDEDLVAIVNKALIFLFPSFAEGFGIPILDAQACGIPVITSKSSGTAEVGSHSVYYVNPLDWEDIAKAVVALKENENLRNDLSAKGFKNCKRFSWQLTADQTIEVLKKVAV